MNENSENQIGLQEALSDPLRTIDRIIEVSGRDELNPGDLKRYKKLLLRCILYKGGNEYEAMSCEDEEVEEKAKDLLGKFQPMQNKEVIAACYMRLLAEPCMEWATIPPWRPKIISFIDAFLGPVFYKDWKIDNSYMAHDKVPLLVEVVRRQEESLQNAFEALTSFDQLQAHRQKLMATLKSRTGILLLNPFLPQNVESLLSDVYKLIERYLEQRESFGCIDIYQECLESINRLFETLTNKGTHYSNLLSDKIGTHLSNLLKEDFACNKAAQLTSVIVEARAKKYPLHLVGNYINLGFIVRNIGPGYAYNTRLVVLVDEQTLEISNSEVELGRLPPYESQLIRVPAKVIVAQENVDVVAQVYWRDYAGGESSTDTLETIKAQRSDIDWLALQQKDPYSLEPIEKQDELVGRQEVLNRLLASLKASNIGSSIIHGQKRVGKTSIAKVLQAKLRENGYLVVYLEAGDYVMPLATNTINGLGSKICKKIIEGEPKASYLQIPVFDQALSPLTDFLDEISNIVPEKRIVIILDEFDELPLDLYLRGPWGDSFFLTLRSISSRPNIGFILVGGEKMAHILDCQGDQLNKWSLTPVDYFSKETNWSDYKELVHRPVQDILEYTEDGTAFLHELTAGNPYFTKLICQYIFRQAINMRDCYITKAEIEQVVELAIRETGRNTFQHFWEDGIFETGEKATEKSIRRRRILIALSDLLQKQSPAPGKSIATHNLVRDIPTLENDLKEFVTRKVLIGNIAGQLSDHTYKFKVEFFHLWLKGRGIQDVIATFSDLDAALRERQLEEQLKVQSSEVVELAEKWGVYKGQKVTEDKIRAWLNQFSSIREQRIMYLILKGLHFYSNEYIRSKMHEVKGIVTRGLGRYKEYRQQKRSDILVSYIDGPSKSGAVFARLFADETDIYVDNVIEKGGLAEELNKRENIKAVVFLDDFVGTGDQASENLQAVGKLIFGTSSGSEIKVFFIAVVGVKSGMKKVKETVASLNLPVEVHCCEMLDESMQYFSKQSTIFPNEDQREQAREISLRYGKHLVRDNPLGYGELGIAIVFEHSCPNDSLPIIWAESTTPKWMPLFRRH